MSVRSRAESFGSRSRRSSMHAASPGPFSSPVSPSLNAPSQAALATQGLLRSLYTDTLYTDVVFRVRQTRTQALDPSETVVETDFEHIACHKCVLVCASPFFARVIAEATSTERIPVIDAPHADVSSFRLIKRWVYLRELGLLASELDVNMRKTAALYGLQDLEFAIGAAIGRSLSTAAGACEFLIRLFKNSIDTVSEHSDLMQFAMTTLCFDAAQLPFVENVGKLPFDVLRMLFASDDFPANEEIVWQLFLAYATQATAAASPRVEESVDALLSLVRLVTLPEEAVLRDLATRGLLTDRRADVIRRRYEESAAIFGPSPTQASAVGLAALALDRSAGLRPRTGAGGRRRSLAGFASNMWRGMASLFRGRRAGRSRPEEEDGGAMRRSMSVGRRRKLSEISARARKSFADDDSTYNNNNRGISFSSVDLDALSGDLSARRASSAVDDELFDDGNGVEDELASLSLIRCECLALTTLISWHYNFKGDGDPIFEDPRSNQLVPTDLRCSKPMRAGGPPQSFKGTVLGNWEVSQPDGEPMPVEGIAVTGVRFVVRVTALAPTTPLFIGVCVQEGGTVHRVFKTGIMSDGKAFDMAPISADLGSAEQRCNVVSTFDMQPGSYITVVYRAIDSMLDCFVDGVLVHQVSTTASGWFYPLMQMAGVGASLLELVSYQALIQRDANAVIPGESTTSSFTEEAFDTTGAAATAQLPQANTSMDDMDDPTIQ